MPFFLLSAAVRDMAKIYYPVYATTYIMRAWKKINWIVGFSVCTGQCFSKLKTCILANNIISVWYNHTLFDVNKYALKFCGFNYVIGGGN